MVTRFSVMFLACVAFSPSVGCSRGKATGLEEVPPQLSFQELRFRVYRGTELTAQGAAMQASFRRDTGDVEAERVAVRFPASGDRDEAWITARLGKGNLPDRRFTGEDGVRAEQAGEVVTTSEAHYLASDGLVRGEKPVEARSGKFTVRGPGFTLDPLTEKLTILGGAKAVTGAP